MSDARATLQLDLDVGRNANAVIAGQALIAWAEALEEASRLVDPYGAVAIELVGTEAGCIRLHAVFRFLEHQLFDPTSEALAPYPKLRAFLALNVITLPSTFVVAVVGGLVVNHYSANIEAGAERRLKRNSNSLT